MANTGSGVLRPAVQRPSLGRVLRRSVATILIVTIALLLSSWILGGFEIERFRDALLAGLVVGLFNAFVWPAFAFVLVPLSVYTLGLANFAVNALVTWAVLDQVPGVSLDGFWTALLVALITTTVASRSVSASQGSWPSSRCIASSTAFRLSGRFSVASTTPFSRFSMRIAS